MDSKTNILFVAFEFPPLGGAGVQRSLKFVKYLPQFNVNPIVITVKEDDYKSVMSSHPMDPGLCNDLPAGTIIKRIHCASPKPTTSKLKNWARIYFSVTADFKDLWKEELDKELPGIINEYKPKAIYVTMPPFVMASLWLKILHSYDLPLIIDFRDGWSQWCVAPNATYFHYLLKLNIEKKVLKRAVKVVCSSNQIKEDLIRVHPSIPTEKFTVINNGYDEVLTVADTLKISQKNKWVIGYVGSFYYTPASREQIFMPWYKRPPHRMPNYVPRKEDWLYRSPYFFFKAIRTLMDAKPELADTIEIRFAGKTPDWLLKQIEEFGLKDNCIHTGYLNHDAVIAFQKECDALLLTSSKVIDGKDYSIAGKTYEYFSIGKPILGFVCEGAQKDILAETGMSVICDPDNIQQSAEQIERLFNGSIILKPDATAIAKYHRKPLTAKLAGLIEQITS